MTEYRELPLSFLSEMSNLKDDLVRGVDALLVISDAVDNGVITDEASVGNALAFVWSGLYDIRKAMEEKVDEAYAYVWGESR